MLNVAKVILSLVVLTFSGSVLLCLRFGETLGLREGGFGILMSRGLVDELSYNEKGNEVRLVKYCPPRAQTADGNGSAAATP